MRRVMTLCVVVLLGCANGDGPKPDGSPGGDLPINQDLAVDGPGTDGPVDGPGVDAPTGDLPLSPDAPPADQTTVDGGNNSCAGATKLTWSGGVVSMPVDTTNATDTMDLGSSSCTGDVTSGNDLFFSIQLPAGAFDIELTSALDPALYVLSSCSPSACVGGSDNVGSGKAEKVTVTPTGPTTYIIVVDAYSTSEAGASTLTIRVSTGTDGGVDAPQTPDGGSPQLVITEIMPNPSAVSDGNGEYFEIYNAGSAPIDLNGWKIKDDGSDSHVIASTVVVGAGKYVVLGVNALKSANGGVDVDYKYSTFFLSNSADEVVLVDKSGSEVDRVAWTSSWGITSGAAHQLRGLTLNNNIASSWCVSATQWPGSAGDKGTPGAANSCPLPDAGVPDVGVPDSASPDAGVSDGPVPDSTNVPYCPPPGTTFSNPPKNLGDLNGQKCGYTCWGSGNLFNECAPKYWQFCLPQGVFAPCQPQP